MFRTKEKISEDSGFVDEITTTFVVLNSELEGANSLQIHSNWIKKNKHYRCIITSLDGKTFQVDAYFNINEFGDNVFNGITLISNNPVIILNSNNGITKKLVHDFSDVIKEAKVFISKYK